MTILLRHVLPNIRGTLLTVIALAYTSMLEGAVLTETVFSWRVLGATSLQRSSRVIPQQSWEERC